MKVEREVIIDLLPAYFSGESSAATRALVEDYFHEHPDFENMARAANQPLEGLKVPFAALDEAKEKLALERARQVTEARTAFRWLAIFFTLVLPIFRFQDHKIIWILWHDSPVVGVFFALVAGCFWVFYWILRKRKEPLHRHTVFLWLACFYTVLLFLPKFKLHDHKVVWFFFGQDADTGVLFGVIALVLWISYFFQRWKAKQS
jgi:hypothetical protein